MEIITKKEDKYKREDNLNRLDRLTIIKLYTLVCRFERGFFTENQHNSRKKSQNTEHFHVTSRSR